MLMAAAPHSTPKGKFLSVGDFDRGIQELGTARDELRNDVDSSKVEIERLSEECKALVRAIERTGKEEALSRAEARNALAEAREARALTEDREGRLRGMATEMQQLRDNMVDTYRRTNESIESCRSRAAADVEDLRHLIRDLSGETRALHQSVSSIETLTHRQREEHGSEEMAAMVAKRVERDVGKQVSEILRAAELWQSRSEIWKQKFSERLEELRRDVQERLEDVAKRQTLITGVSSFSKCDGQGSPGEGKPLIEYQDMPRTWRLALDDSVRRVQHVSDETRQLVFQRFEALQASLEVQMVAAKAEQKRCSEDVREASSEAIQQSAEALVAAKRSKDIAQQCAEALSSKVAAAVDSFAGDIREQCKVALREVSAPLEDALRCHQSRLTALDGTCTDLERELSLRIEEMAKAFANKFDDAEIRIQSCCKGIDEQKAKFTGFFRPFQEEVERRIAEIWSESGDIRSLVGKQEEKLSKDIISIRTALETKLAEASRSIASLSTQVEDNALEWADQSGKTNAFKRELQTETSAAVNERCARSEEMAHRAIDDLLSKVEARLSASASSSNDLHSKVECFDVALEGLRSQTLKQADQMQDALNATERLATAARSDAEGAANRSKSVEALIMAILRPEQDHFLDRRVATHEISTEFQDDIRQRMNGSTIPSASLLTRQGEAPNDISMPILNSSMGGSGRDAAKQLRTQTPRQPWSDALEFPERWP